MDDEVNDIVTYMGHRIRELREKRGMSLRELSRMTDVSLAHLSEVERGLSRISADRLYGIADVFNRRMDTFFP